MKHTALPLRVKHHHVQDGTGGIVKSIIYRSNPLAGPLCEIHWNEEFAEFIVRACNSHEELVEALQRVEPMATTLMNELSGIEATQWGIVNDCLVAVRQALAKATK